MPRILYFDIDGTILAQDTGEPKSALAAGRLEFAVRAAKFDELVCVGNFVAVAHTMLEFNARYDALGTTFSLCQGVFQDEAWFRAVTQLALDPRNRALEIDQQSDWWYMDDCARDFMSRAGLSGVFEIKFGRRILVPTPDGDGTDVLTWLESVPART